MDRIQAEHIVTVMGDVQLEAGLRRVIRSVNEAKNLEEGMLGA